MFEAYDQYLNGDAVVDMQAGTEQARENIPNNQNSQTDPEPSRPQKKKRMGLRIAALALCCSLLGGAVGAGGVMLGTKTNTVSEKTAQTTVYTGQREGTAVTVASVNTSEKKTAAQVYAQNVDSAVGITTTTTMNAFGRQMSTPASGSGFVLTSDGYIVTNYHVIEGANAITVTTYSGDEYEAAVVGYDESNDLAVLKVEAEGLSTVILGDSDLMAVGDDVIAIGNPFGELTFSLTSGAVSAMNREVTVNNVTMNLIQTDCAINSGNSGGALFNLFGEVIGITNAKYSSSSSSAASVDNIGFAIPINSVKEIIANILENGYYAKPYIGVTIQNVSEEMQNFGIPKGAAVYSVTKGSPADAAGLCANDVIIAVNGTEITGSSELKKIVSDSTPGTELTLTVSRKGEKVDLTVIVGEMQQGSTETVGDPQSEPQQNRGGMTMPFGNFGSSDFGNFGSSGDSSDSGSSGFGNFGGSGSSGWH